MVSTAEAAAVIACKTVEIATLPEVTLRIVQVVQDPRSTAHDLHRIVSNDPALSARVLRVVNSAFYGLPGQIGSIDRAIMMLGLNAVKNIAIAASLSKLFRSPKTAGGFSGKELWMHSVAVGASNKLITKAIGLSLPDEAFLAGLIHDLGLVAVMQCFDNKVPELIELVESGMPFRQAEDQVLGANHENIGAILAKTWKFPRSFQCVAGYHHRPEDLAKEHRLLATVTHISDVLCAMKELGISLTTETEEINGELLDEIGLTVDQLNQVAENIEAELDVVRAMIE